MRQGPEQRAERAAGGHRSTVLSGGQSRALFDALQLAEALTGTHPTLSEALYVFETGMHARTEQETAASTGVHFYGIEPALAR